MRIEPESAAFRATSLPHPTTPIIGRSDEVAVLREHLARGTRLVTVAGLGGLGKTRVVLEAVQAVPPSDSELPIVFWCDTAALTTTDDLLWSLGVTLGIELPAARLQSDPWGALAAATAALPRHTIVLDALEGLAPTVAAGLEAWLLRSPPTSLVVTSRRELGTASEHVLALGPLPSGTVDAPATRLLLARARQVRPGWAHGDEESVAALAQRLDGWPLLLELFAAEARAASPGTLAQFLDVERTTTSTSGRAAAAMQAILDRAWTALSPHAARALTRLAALEGTFDLELAAATLQVGPSEALGLLVELASHSLVGVHNGDDGDDGATVHRLLDTVRTHVLRRGDPDEIANARRLATQAILARHAPTQDPAIGRQPLLPTRDLQRLFALVERGLKVAEPEAIADAFSAAHILLAGFRAQRSTLAPIESCVRLVNAASGARHMPIATRLAVVRELARCVLAPGAPEVLSAAVDVWISESESGPTPADKALFSEIREELLLQVVTQHFAEWRHRDVLEILASFPADTIVRGSFLWHRHVLFSVLARRGLGLTDPGDGAEGADELLLTELAHSAAAQGLAVREIKSLVNLTFLTGQLGRPHALSLARDVVARCEANRTRYSQAYAVRELARIEVEHGLMRAALAHHDAAVAEGVVSPRDITEMALERAATLLEGARVEEAWEALHAMPTGEETRFSRAYGASLRWAVGWMHGRAIPSERWPMEQGPTDTVEDHAIAILRAIGRPELEEALARAGQSARFSTRVRQAVRIGSAVLGALRGEVLAVSLDGASFRLGTSWQSLQTRPLLASLLEALVASRLKDPERTLSKDELGAILWPGDRSAPEHRDNRLHVAVSSLRRLGLGTMLVHDGSGFRLDPARPVVRLVESALM